MAIAFGLPRYGFVVRQVSPIGSSPLVSTGCGATFPCAFTTSGGSASASARPRRERERRGGIAVMSAALLCGWCCLLVVRTAGGRRGPPPRGRRRGPHPVVLLRELEDPEHAALVDAEVLLRDLAAPERHGAAPARRHCDELLTLRLPGDGRRGDAGAGV